MRVGLRPCFEALFSPLTITGEDLKTPIALKGLSEILMSRFRAGEEDDLHMLSEAPQSDLLHLAGY